MIEKCRKIPLEAIHLRYCHVNGNLCLIYGPACHQVIKMCLDICQLVEEMSEEEIKNTLESLVIQPVNKSLNDSLATQPMILNDSLGLMNQLSPQLM